MVKGVLEGLCPSKITNSPSLIEGGGVDAIDTISQISESLRLTLIKPLAKPSRRYGRHAV